MTFACSVRFDPLPFLVFAAAEHQWASNTTGQILPPRNLRPFPQEHPRFHQAWSSDQTASPAKSVLPSAIGSPPLARQGMRRRRGGTRATRALVTLQSMLSPLPHGAPPRLASCVSIHNGEQRRRGMARGALSTGYRVTRPTWTFAHTTAAYYPESPTTTQRAHMLQLLHALPQLYPCSHCAEDLGTRMQRRPPDVRSRAALAAWLCATHNEVNAKLGKPSFDCARVDERWRDGLERWELRLIGMMGICICYRSFIHFYFLSSYDHHSFQEYTFEVHTYCDTPRTGHLPITGESPESTPALLNDSFVLSSAIKITPRTAGMAMLTARGSSSNVLVVFCATDSN